MGDGDGAVVTVAGNEGEGEAVQSSDTVSVTVPLTGVSVFANFIRWSDNYSLGSTFDANGEEQILTTVDLNNASPSGQVYISITTTNNRFTPAFEASGVIIFEASDGETLEVMIADADISEPYSWVPSNSLEVVAFVLHVKDLTDQTGTLTLRGEGEAVVVVTGDGDGAAVSVTGNEGEGRAVSTTAIVRTGDGDGATITVTGNEGEGEAVAAVVDLVLADFDDTGLDVDAAALLVASAPGTTGNDIYADSDRGGTDSPLDGDLGVSSNDTLISRIRRISDTVLVLNDNNNPGVLDLNTYFGAGGDGADLTLSLQTVADGLVSFAVADQLVNSGANFAQFTLPADAQTLLDNLATDDRWILVLARPATVDVAPSFTDSTGDDQDWIQNTAITDITVPTASGTPTPTYAVEGSLPAGIAFDTSTRVISRHTNGDRQRHNHHSRHELGGRCRLDG